MRLAYAPAFWGPLGFALVLAGLLMFWMLIAILAVAGIILLFGAKILYELYLAIVRRVTARRQQRRPAWKGGDNPWKKGGPRSAAVQARKRSA
jgi:hypothetical protein